MSEVGWFLWFLEALCTGVKSLGSDKVACLPNGKQAANTVLKSMPLISLGR